MTRPSRFEMIANQMMKGINSRCAPNGRASTQELITSFQKRYYDTIKYIEVTLPKNISVGVCGAVGKAILWHGKDKVTPFATAVANRDYRGRNDPVLILWEWLLRNNTRTHFAREIYGRTVTAIRFYLRGAPMDSGKLSVAIDDIFEWGEDYTMMVKPKRNQHTRTSVKSEKRQTFESMWEEIEAR